MHIIFRRLCPVLKCNTCSLHYAGTFTVILVFVAWMLDSTRRPVFDTIFLNMEMVNLCPLLMINNAQTSEEPAQK
jgi:hypothetical protein